MPLFDTEPVAAFLAAIADAESLGREIVHHEVVPARPERFAEPARPWPGLLASALAARGVTRLFSHQALAADMVRMGRHTVVATPTASGKTMVYNLPVLEATLANPDAKALYLYPLKALAQDQLRALEALAGCLPPQVRPRAAIYDGDTATSLRRKLRDNPPAILLTNPEMVHLSLLPHHDTWAAFWAGLTHVVVDEVHTMRGVMGSHMAMVFRRLRRIAAYYGADPTFVFCSATVANPAELATQLTGLPAEVVDDSGAPQGSRHYLFVNPEGSPATTAIRLLREALERGLRTIVYCRSRRMTELISMWAQEKAGEFTGKISAYRAGFLPEERREIEARMSEGELLAVISTSALELGIDIGSLDLCILVGYPGTIMATLQRGGRVGRKQQESAVVLVAGEDALDQYFMRHPREFFDRPPESAVLNPGNPVIVARHLECAASELSLKMGEPFLAELAVAACLREGLNDGSLLESADGRTVLARRKRPQREVSLRGAGDPFVIEEEGSGRIVGQADTVRAFKEVHEGAVYLHRGRTYLVSRFDLNGRTSTVKPARVGYYTRVRAEKTTEILEVFDRRRVLGTHVGVGRLRVTEVITGYEKRATSGNRLLTIVPLELPPIVFETEGLWYEIPDAVRDATEAARYHFMGGIHASEHAAIGILPLLVMADRDDLGGISTPIHPQVGRGAVFIYDGHPGGVGLSRLAFAKAEELLRHTLTTIASCPCELGCPSCVHSPKCGSGNRPIAKDAAIFVLERLLDPQARDEAAMPPLAPPRPIPGVDALPESEAAPRLPGQAPCVIVRTAPARYGVLDVETRRSAAEVGGWHRAQYMGISVAVLYDAADDTFHAYPEERTNDLIEHLRALDLVVGFNVRRFDYAVVAGALGLTRRVLDCLPTLDLLESVTERLGYRLKLDNLAAATLNAPKTADGLQALEWWKEGRLDLITEYCIHDTKITRDLYRHGLEHGHVLFTNKAGAAVKLPTSW